MPLKTTLVTAPAIEPLTLTEIKEHLRSDSTTFADSLSETQDLAPASYAIGTHLGAGTDVLAHRTIVTVNMGAIAGAETVDVTIQDSDDNVTYTNWTGGTFTQFDAANSSTTDEIEYTGGKQYIRTSSVVAVGAVVFGIIIIEKEPPTAEDNFLTAARLAARRHVENILGRKLITQTWHMFLNEWPEGDNFLVPYPPLQHYAVTTVAGENITFTNVDSKMTSAGTPFDVAELRVGRKFIVDGSGSNDGVYTVAAITTSVITVSETVTNEGPTASITFETTILTYIESDASETEPWDISYYIVDTDSEPGRIVLDYGEAWPTVTLYPSNPIRLRFECGYGDAASDVPGDVLNAMKLCVADMYSVREPTIIGVSAKLLETIDNLLSPYIDWTWQV